MFLPRCRGSHAHVFLRHETVVSSFVFLSGVLCSFSINSFEWFVILSGKRRRNSHLLLQLKILLSIEYLYHLRFVICNLRSLTHYSEEYIVKTIVREKAIPGNTVWLWRDRVRTAALHADEKN